MTIIHTPVLLAETLELLGAVLETAGTDGASADADAWMIDGTVGEGGHSEAFLSRFPALHLTAVDADGAVLERAKARLSRFGSRVQFCRCWSEDFFSGECACRKADIILIDLGVSLFHYEQGGRGFSFRKDEPLDMRIDTGYGRSAADLLAVLREDELADLLWHNAEERHSRRIASAIVKARARSRIETSAALAAIVASAMPGGVPARGMHPATKTFQALRIAVNGELERLERRLEAAFGALKAGGRMGVISFHSLEDRIVKNFFREKEHRNMPINKSGECRLVTKKPVTADGIELRSNPPSRSAKLRVVEKTVNSEQ
ncbi:MAG: 16S rRNA (cytosine(1402)-N(4))-methyltransferase RsmH [Spirochaetaceae bacterium]|jgi:16S rRNA (cytosine1402-N4)-methyltransferase|nr:16S rRNA (cytosine(1402)-N(4))-methyltransferase RsmH [Spirochaetaceae bacterium]